MDAEAGTRRRAHLEASTAFVVEGEAALQCGEADAAALGRVVDARRIATRTVVLDAQREALVRIARRPDADAAALRAGRHAMQHAVLHERLQAERRNLVLQRRRIELPVDMQARSEPQALEGQVVA